MQKTLASSCSSGTRFGVRGGCLLALSIFLVLPVAAQPSVSGAPVAPAQFNGNVANLPQRNVPSHDDFLNNEFPDPPNTKVDQTVPRALLALPSGPTAPMPSPNRSFDGLSYTDSVTGGQAGSGYPPDINGEVGRNHYIESVNKSFAIYSKSGTRLAAFSENALWNGAGSTPCNGNSFGDPVILYDQLADRWFLTNFAFALDASNNLIPPFYECVAVSKTSDPVAGGWWLYAFRMDPGGTGFPPIGTLNDYPKFRIWPDCLYMSANEFTMPAGTFAGTAFASFNRTDMEAGATVRWALGFLNNTSDPFTMIPSNLLGVTPGSMPPVGTPNYFVSESQTVFAFEVRKFTAGANCAGGGTLSAPVNVAQTSYTVPGSDIVPQPNTTNVLDSLGDRLMQKVQYRKIGAAESLWVTHTVRPSSAAPTAIQWAQISVTAGVVTPTPVQQQIYAPDTTIFRWVPSIAADGAGNVAVGYATANGTSPNFPSIAYSGRLALDPVNSLPQTETVLIAGGGSQVSNCGGGPCHRWGDYTSMSIDPADDCTFWYANQYYSSQANGSSGNWQTRIGSFKFPSCTSVAIGQGLILKSPDGTKCSRVTVDVLGILVPTAVPCP